MIAAPSRRRWIGSPILAMALLACGCASLTNPIADAVPVREVPQECLCPPRDKEITVPLNLLSLPADRIYRVASGDVLGIWIEGILGPTNQVPPLHVTTLPTPRDQRRTPSAVGYPVTVEPGGIIRLPLIEPLTVRGMTAAEIQQLIRDEYSVKRKLLKNGNERILVSVLQPRQIRVLVLRQEAATFVAGTIEGILPGSKTGNGQIIELGDHENDVLHALTLSGGLPGLDAYNKITVFRNGFRPESGSHDRCRAAPDAAFGRDRRGSRRDSAADAAGPAAADRGRRHHAARRGHRFSGEPGTRGLLHRRTACRRASISCRAIGASTCSRRSPPCAARSSTARSPPTTWPAT